MILDLSGGYGRVTPYLLRGDDRAVLADLSIHSLRVAKKTLKENVDFIARAGLDLEHYEEWHYHSVIFSEKDSE